MSAGWGEALAGREVTFKSSERSALITDAPNVYALFADEELAPYLEDFQAGTLASGTIGMRLAEEIVRLMMVRPRILHRGEPMPSDQDPDDPAAVPYSALTSGEVEELLEIWEASIDRAARFRGERDGSGDGEAGPGVGGKPKRKARASTRKPSGASA